MTYDGDVESVPVETELDPAWAAYLEQIDRWHNLTVAISNLQAQEKALRESLFAGTFTAPTEGVNSFPLPDGRVLKGTYKLNRTVDQTGAAALPKKLRDAAFKSKLELVLKNYRDLPEEDRKVVDGVITTKPGLPALELVPAKEH